MQHDVHFVNYGPFRVQREEKAVYGESVPSLVISDFQKTNMTKDFTKQRLMSQYLQPSVIYSLW